MRYFPRYDTTRDSDGSRQDRGRCEAVDVIVADNHDPLAVADCLDGASNGAVEIRQSGWIKNVAPFWIEKAGSQCRRVPSPCDQYSSRYGMDPKLIDQMTAVYAGSVSELPTELAW